MTHVVLPIMFDLAKSSTTIIPGPGTTYTLEEAAMLVNRRTAAEKSAAMVLFTACEATNPKWQRVNMGRLCETWFNRRWPHINTTYEQADTFNTVGELEALTRYLNQNRNVTSATIVVKSWHAPRVRLIVRRIQKAGHLKTPVTVRSHRYPWRIDMYNVGTMVREQIAYAVTYARYQL